MELRESKKRYWREFSSAFHVQDVRSSVAAQNLKQLLMLESVFSAEIGSILKALIFRQGPFAHLK